MGLLISQLQECKVCSLLCSINEEKGCLDLLHLWRRDESPICTAVWFVGSHKVIRAVPESLQGSLPFIPPFSSAALTRRFSLDTDPQCLGGSSMQKWRESPLIFFYMRLRLEFSFANTVLIFSTLPPWQKPASPETWPMHFINLFLKSDLKNMGFFKFIFYPQKC